MPTINNTLNTISDPAATSPEKAKFVASTASKAYKGPSIVDYLSLSGQPTDQASRAALGQKYGIEGIAGANNAAGNTQLLNALRSGQQSQAQAETSVGGASNNDIFGGQPNTQSGAVVDAQGNLVSGGTGTTPGVTQESPEDRYLRSLTKSDESVSAERRLNEMDTQAKLDYENALEKGDTLGFARGEAGLTARQNAILRGGQAASVSAYAALDANRERIGEARYKYEQDRLDREAGQNPQFGLSQGQERFGFNSETGQYESIASVAPKADDPQDAAYRAAQIRDIESKIKDRTVKAEEDNSGYKIPKSARNIIEGMNFSTEEVDQLQQNIRDYGIATVLSWYEKSPSYLQLRQLLNTRGLIYEG